jgi:hypothetical protein
MTPIFPELSLKAISRSPSNISRIGASLERNSRDIAAGIQY